MSTKQENQFGLATVVVVVAASFVLVSTGLAQDHDSTESNCQSYVEATLQREEVLDGGDALSFKVDVESGETCARIAYQLIVKEIMVNGETKEVPIRRQVKLNGGNLSELVQHRMASGNTLGGYDTEVISCMKCEIMP